MIIKVSKTPGRYSPKFYTRRLRSEVQPLTLLCNDFDREETPSIDKGYPFHKPCLEYYVPFNCFKSVLSLESFLVLFTSINCVCKPFLAWLGTRLHIGGKRTKKSPWTKKKKSAKEASRDWGGERVAKWQISLPFYTLQLMRSLPFYIPEAWKRYPFRTEPPRIGRYIEYPLGQIRRVDGYCSILFIRNCFSFLSSCVLY